MMNFDIEQYPYDEDNKVLLFKSLKLDPGITVLVGCNGSGKSTLLCNIQSSCEDRDIPCKMIDNFHGGARDTLSRAGFYCTDMAEAVSMLTFKSEGQKIYSNLKYR